MRGIAIGCALGLLVLLVVTPAFAAQECVEYDGLTYCPEGRASVTTGGEGVTVSNLSLSGADGVSVDLSKGGPAASVGNRIQLGSEAATGAAYVQLAAQGLIEGEMGTIIRTTLWGTGSAVYVSNDYPDMPVGDDVVAVVANDRIVGLIQNQGEGTMVRLRPLSGSAKARFIKGDDGLVALPAAIPNAVDTLEVDLICPDEDPWDLWNLCLQVPCTGGDIALVGTGGGTIGVDVLSPTGELLGSFEGSNVMITRTGGDASRSPFLIETVTGAGFDAFRIQETRVFEPMR